MINWHLDLFPDFSEICIAMRVEPEASAQGDWNQYARRFDEWKKTTAHSRSGFRSLRLRFDDASGTKTLLLDPSAHRFEPGDLAGEFRGIARRAARGHFSKSLPGGTLSRRLH